NREIQYVNNGFVQMTGYEADIVKGRRTREFLVGPNTDPQTRKRIEAELDAPRAFYDEIEIHRKSGNALWISVTSNPVYDKKQQHIGFIAILADITAVKTTALDFSTRLNTISQSSLLVEWDLNGKLLQLNDYPQNVLGIAATQFSDALHSWSRYLN